MTQTLDLPSLAASAPAFQQETANVLARLRSALIELLSVPVGGIHKSLDVQKHYGVDAKLSWQIFRMISCPDPLQLAPFVPAAGPLRRLLAAAKKRGAPEALVSAAAAAHEAFERHIRTHAGDRTTFDAMLDDVTHSDAAQQANLLHRRSIVEGYQHILGVQLDVLVRAFLAHPGSSPGICDFASLRAKIGLRRLRPQLPLVVDRSKMMSGGETDEFVRDALDPDAARTYGAPVIPSFCSASLPHLRSQRMPDGRTLAELTGDAVGRLGSVDLTFGHAWRNVPLDRAQSGPFRGRFGFGGSTAFNLPARLAILDTFVHRPTFGRMEHELAMWGQTMNLSESSPELAGAPQLPCRERVVFLGSGAAAARTAEATRYVEMLQFTTRRLGWDLEEFDVYRIRIEYPLTFTAVTCTFTIPGSETWPDASRLAGS